MKIGDKIQGVITGIQPYGAFVDLDNQTRGLIHISEIKTGFVENIHDILKVGQKVLVQVVDYDEFTGKASLSLRTLEEEKQAIPSFSASSFSLGCQSHGVYASSYRPCSVCPSQSVPPVMRK